MANLVDVEGIAEINEAKHLVRHVSRLTEVTNGSRKGRSYPGRSATQAR